MSAHEGTEEDFRQAMLLHGKWPHSMADGLDGQHVDFAVVRVWWAETSRVPHVYRFLARPGPDGQLDGSLGAFDELRSAVTRAKLILSPRACAYANVREQVARFGSVYCDVHGGIADGDARTFREGMKPRRCSLGPHPPVPPPTLAWIVGPPFAIVRSAEGTKVPEPPREPVREAVEAAFRDADAHDAFDDRNTVGDDEIPFGLDDEDPFGTDPEASRDAPDDDMGLRGESPHRATPRASRTRYAKPVEGPMPQGVDDVSPGTMPCRVCRGIGRVHKGRGSVDTCASCGGSGQVAKDMEAETCRSCGGMGRVTRGFVTTVNACPDCGGRGRVLKARR